MVRAFYYRTILWIAMCFLHLSRNDCNSDPTEYIFRANIHDCEPESSLRSCRLSTLSNAACSNLHLRLVSSMAHFVAEGTNGS